ncbi:MAG: porin [Nitrosomonadales bacterium]|nr:porin [Nitrosomonadales bacterium]
MQKKLIVAALTAAIATPVSALADNGNFTFYGKADVSYDSINTGNGTTTANGATNVTGVTKRVVSSNVSKFGFKGSEDLGDGLSAIWQVEQQINIDDSSNSCSATTIAATTIPAGGGTVPAATVPACSANNGIFATRNTFAGLKSETLGTLLFGRHDTPYKISTRKLDPFGDNIGDNRALLGYKSNNGGFELRPTNVLAYFSPAFAGVTAAVAMVNSKESNTKSTDKNDSVTSMAVMYDVAPFYGSVAYESHALESVVSGGKESATRLGFGFKPERFELGAVYEKTTDNLGTAQGNKHGHNAIYVSGKMNIGNDAVKLGYTKAGILGSGVDEVKNSGASQISVGYDHGLSKRTKVYALYTRITNGKGVNYGFSQSTAASSSNSGYGTSPAVMSLGVQHNF